MTAELKFGDIQLDPVRIPDHRMNDELALLAKELKTEMVGHFTHSYYAERPMMEAIYKGFRCKIVGLTHGNGGLSVSIVLLMPKSTRFNLRLQNVVGVRINHYVDLERTEAEPVYNMTDEIAFRVLHPVIHYELLRSGLDYLLTITDDRITLTAYHAYQHKLYLDLLDLLIIMASTLMEIANLVI